MKTITLLTTIMFIMSGITLWASESENYKNQYNAEALQLLLENEEWADSSEREDIAFWLFWIHQQKKVSSDEIESNIFDAINIIDERISSGDISAKSYYRLSILYRELIKDAPSWIKYNDLKNNYLNLCFSIDPHYKDARILETRNLLFFHGGDQSEGFKKLETLNNEYPEDADILITYGDFFLEQEEPVKAKDYYSRVLNLIPNHFRANKNYKDLSLIEGKMPINSIIVKNSIKTKLGRTVEQLQKKEGEIYSMEVKREIERIYDSLPSITGVQIESVENSSGSIDLSLDLSEDNTKIFGVLANVSLAGEYDETLSPGGLGALLYMDNNIFGTGNSLTVIFAGIYLGLDFEIFERPSFPLALSFHADGLFLPQEFNFIENGQETDWEVKTPEYNLSLGLKKETSFGLTISSEHNLRINNFKGGISRFTKPENNLTYRVDFEFVFSTISLGFPSSFSPPTGFSISTIPAIIYKPDYKSWGLNTDLYSHNDLPGAMFESSVKFYKNPSKRTYLGGSLTHCAGVNLYESEKWEIGQTNIMSSGLRLSGYYSNEFRSDNAIMANLDGHFQIITNKILIFAKHDMFYDIEKNRINQGSALGLAFKLPYEIELNLEAGLGWNAERENGPGWNIQMTLARYFFL